MPDSDNPNGCSKKESKHALDYFIAMFLVLTFIATATAAWYTRQQWLTMHDTEIRQLRAYVFPIEAVISNFETDKPVIGTIIFKNSGQTPAYKVQIRTYIMFGPYLLREDLPHPDVTAARALLGPGVGYQVTVRTARPLTTEEVALVKQGGGAIYVYGNVDLTDAFEFHRCIKFRYFFGGDMRTPPTGQPGALSTYRDGNEEDC